SVNQVLGLLFGYVVEAIGSSGRTYHHTAPVATVTSLHAALERILAEGLENVWERHAEAGRILQDGLQEMGLELFAQEGYRLPELTTVKVPDDVDAGEVRKIRLDRHNFHIGGGVGQFAWATWRLGLLCPNASPDSALLVSAALVDPLNLARR